MGAHSNSHQKQQVFEQGFFSPWCYFSSARSMLLSLWFSHLKRVALLNSNPQCLEYPPILKLIFSKNKTVSSIVQRTHDINPITLWALVTICKNRSGVCLQILVIFPATLCCKTTVCLECIWFYKTALSWKLLEQSLSSNMPVCWIKQC